MNINKVFEDFLLLSVGAVFGVLGMAAVGFITGNPTDIVSKVIAGIIGGYLLLFAIRYIQQRRGRSNNANAHPPAGNQLGLFDTISYGIIAAVFLSIVVIGIRQKLSEPSWEELSAVYEQNNLDGTYKTAKGPSMPTPQGIIPGIQSTITIAGQQVTYEMDLGHSKIPVQNGSITGRKGNMIIIFLEGQGTPRIPHTMICRQRGSNQIVDNLGAVYTKIALLPLPPEPADYPTNTQLDERIKFLQDEARTDDEMAAKMEKLAKTLADPRQAAEALEIAANDRKIASNARNIANQMLVDKAGRTANNKDTVDCDTIKRLSTKPAELAKVASVKRIFECTGKTLIYVTPMIDKNHQYFPGHYEFVTPVIAAVKQIVDGDIEAREKAQETIKINEKGETTHYRGQ